MVALAKKAMAALTITMPDVAEFVSGSLNLRNITSMSAQQRLAVKKVSSSPGQSSELHDAVPMVALLAKLGGWEAPQRVEVESNTKLTTPVDTSSMTAEELSGRQGLSLKCASVGNRMAFLARLRTSCAPMTPLPLDAPLISQHAWTAVLRKKLATRTVCAGSRSA